MEMIEHARLQITDSSTIGEARRRGVNLARSLGLNEVDAGRLALVVTEAATNLVKHAGGGELFLRALQQGQSAGVGVLALDRGPGIRSIGEALLDGFSTGGTPGTGLGAIARIASFFDLYSQAGQGVALLARVWPAGSTCVPERFHIDGINVPHPKETTSGDAWYAQCGAAGPLLVVADGLGHGIGAAEASRTAVETFRKRAGGSPAELVEEIHRALRPTRGAAVAVAAVDPEGHVVRFAGIGNISGTIVSEGHSRNLVSHHGTAGGNARRIQEFSYPWASSDILILNSDGLGSHWTLENYPGLAQRDPALISALLYRDHRRSNDDTTVVALREGA